MTSRTMWMKGALVLVLMTVGAVAHAEDPAPKPPEACGLKALPVLRVNWPLTLPSCVIGASLAAGFDVRPSTAGGSAGDNVVSFGGALGARVGLVPDLELEAIILPFKIWEGARYGNPIFRATYAFTSNAPREPLRSLEVGLRGGIQALTQVNGVRAELGVPLLARTGRRTRVDLIPTLVVGAKVRPREPVEVGFLFPFTLTYGLTDQFRISAHSAVNWCDHGTDGDLGFRLFNFTAKRDVLSVPLGASVGYAVGNDTWRLDISPSVTFPRFHTRTSSAGAFNSDVMFAFTIEYYFDPD